MENSDDFLNRIREFSRKNKSFKTGFDDFPRFVISGERAKPAQTVLKVYLSKSTMVSVHHESNGNGFVFVNYKTRATVLKNLSAHEQTVSENDWFQALAEKIFYYLTLEPNMRQILIERRQALGGAAPSFLLMTGE